ncbi:hypothetical protein CLU79DRAFT_756273 [Phycomyces nitens]|nr:hypothetical protein CLU79DRAFT_756273 [Phycomyces nitens]
MTNSDRFNTPIAVHSSFNCDEHAYNFDQPCLLQTDNDNTAVDIPQHLEPEQYSYEFPPRSHLRALAYLDNYQKSSFFDESSFTTSTSTAAQSLMLESEEESSSFFDYYSSFLSNSSDLDMNSLWLTNNHRDRSPRHHKTDRVHPNHFTEDSRLSPLQLPAQFSTTLSIRQSRKTSIRSREPSSDSISTVTQSNHPVHPSSFLSVSPPNLFRVDEEDENENGNDEDEDEDSIWQESSPLLYCRPQSRPQWHSRAPSDDRDLSDEDMDLPVYWNESEPMTDDMSSKDNDSDFGSDKILIRLGHTHSSPVNRCLTVTYFGSDEGYDDENYDDENDDTKEEPIDSCSIFLPLCDDQEWFSSETRHTAAIKIQAAWRGFQARRKLVLRPQSLMLQVVRVCGTIHQRQLREMNQRLVILERRLREETAMRTEFEKAMEVMTVLIDSQQKTLCERVEQEVAMRETYEHKIELALSHIGPLENRLKIESNARLAMEDKLERVLDQMAELGQAQLSQALEEAESKNALQTKLDVALRDIEELKAQSVSKPRLLKSPQKMIPAVSASGAVKPRRTLVPLPPLKAGHPSTKPNIPGPSITNATKKTTSRR